MIRKHPLLLGLIIFILSLVGWVISIVFNVLTLGAFRWVSNALAVIAFVSLPAALIWKVLMKKPKQDDTLHS